MTIGDLGLYFYGEMLTAQQHPADPVLMFLGFERQTIGARLNMELSDQHGSISEND